MRHAKPVIAFICLFSLGACGLPKQIAEAPVAAVHSGSPPTLSVTVAADANQNSPVAVDIALVRDSKLLKTLSQTPVHDWFQKRTELAMSYPKQLQVLSWEWVPGQTVSPIPIDLGGDVKGAVVFANYAAPAVKPVVVDPRHGLVLNLLRDDIAVRPAQ